MSTNQDELREILEKFEGHYNYGEQITKEQINQAITAIIKLYVKKDAILEKLRVDEDKLHDLIIKNEIKSPDGQGQVLPVYEVVKAIATQIKELVRFNDKS